MRAWIKGDWDIVAVSRRTPDVAGNFTHVAVDLEDLVRLTWDRLAIVPVDQRCIDRATVLMREQPLRLSDALHLAAADRLPRPVR